MIYQAPVRLNLGCSTSYLQGWINVDVNPEVKADIHVDLTESLPFPENYADEILLSHVIEHMNYRSGRILLSDIYRVLQPEGLLRISTPNLNYILENLGKDDPLLQNEYMFGTLENKWQRHIALYTVEMLKSRLKMFSSVVEEFVWHEIRLRAKK